MTFRNQLFGDDLELWKLILICFFFLLPKMRSHITTMRTDSMNRWMELCSRFDRISSWTMSDWKGFVLYSWPGLRCSYQWIWLDFSKLCFKSHLSWNYAFPVKLISKRPQICITLTVRRHQRRPHAHFVDHERRIAAALPVDRVHQQLVVPAGLKAVQFELWQQLLDPEQGRQGGLWCEEKWE